MSATINRRVAELERASPAHSLPQIEKVILVALEPELDSEGYRVGPGRMVGRAELPALQPTRIELVDLKPLGEKP